MLNGNLLRFLQLPDDTHANWATTSSSSSAPHHVCHWHYKKQQLHMQMSNWTIVSGGWRSCGTTMKNAPINELKLYDFANQNGFCSISHLAFGIFTIFHFPFGISHVCRRLDDAAQRSMQLAACSMWHSARVVCEKCNNNWNLIASTTAPRSCHKRVGDAIKKI